MTEIKYQLRVVVYPSNLRMDSKPKKPLFEKYFAVSLDEVRFSSVIDVLSQFYSFPVDIEFLYEPIN